MLIMMNDWWWWCSYPKPAAWTMVRLRSWAPHQVRLRLPYRKQHQPLRLQAQHLLQFLHSYTIGSSQALGSRVPCSRMYFVTYVLTLPYYLITDFVAGESREPPWTSQYRHQVKSKIMLTRLAFHSLSPDGAACNGRKCARRIYAEWEDKNINYCNKLPGSLMVEKKVNVL